MLTIIDDSLEIKKAQERFKQKFLQILDRKNVASVGYKGESHRETFYWSSKLCMWAIFGKTRNRFWNALGLLNKPRLPSLNSIDVEINFPFEGIKRTISGVLAKDDKGNLLIAHRGKIGGGRKGIGKNLFLDNYRGRWAAIKEGKRENIVAPIGMLDTPRFIYQVLNFIKEVKRIKEISRGKIKRVIPKEDKHIFRPEYFGKKYIKLATTEISAEWDHGLIVNTLESILKKQGLKTGNDLRRDLFVVNKTRNICILFEVKPDLSSNSIYSGIGQLLFNSIDLPKKPRLVLVLPDKLNKILISKLRKISIECLYYKWIHEKPVFPNLQDII